MNSFDALEHRLDRIAMTEDPAAGVAEALEVAEAVLAHWVLARGEEPTLETREGFRLLALHRQGARGVPSFNACRETCRELAYHVNLIGLEPGHPQVRQRLLMATLLARHLLLFVRGKLEVEGLGEFCCSSRPLRGGPVPDDEHLTLEGERST